MEQINTQQSPLGQLIGFIGLTIIGVAIIDSLFQNDSDTVNYALKKNGRTVYHGITYEDRLDSRLLEHELKGKKFDLCVYDEVKPRKTAEKLEKRRIKRDNPKYNIHHKF